jgi:very-short-patch-repair endonuclease
MRAFLQQSDRPIAELAEQQHGVVAYWQLVELGYQRRAIQHRLALGRLIRIYKGVYAVGYRKLTQKGHWMAAVLASGKGAVLSHRSAAALWQLRPPPATKTEVTVPVRGRRSQKPICIYSTTVLDKADIDTLDAISVTSVARTLIDLAAVVYPTTLIKAIEESERRERFDLNAIDAAIARSPTRKGVKALTTALKTYRPPPTTNSHLERDFLKAVHRAGLPEPRINTLLYGEEADIYWPQAHLAVEIDGSQYHHSPRELERDRLKDALWQRHGEQILRLTDNRLESDFDGAIADTLALYDRGLRQPRA